MTWTFGAQWMTPQSASCTRAGVRLGHLGTGSACTCLHSDCLHACPPAPHPLSDELSGKVERGQQVRCPKGIVADPRHPQRHCLADHGSTAAARGLLICAKSPAVTRCSRRWKCRRGRLATIRAERSDADGDLGGEELCGRTAAIRMGRGDAGGSGNMCGKGQPGRQQ